MCIIFWLVLNLSWHWWQGWHSRCSTTWWNCSSRTEQNLSHNGHKKRDQMSSRMSFFLYVLRKRDAVVVVVVASIAEHQCKRMVHCALFGHKRTNMQLTFQIATYSLFLWHFQFGHLGSFCFEQNGCKQNHRTGEKYPWSIARKGV